MHVRMRVRVLSYCRGSQRSLSQSECPKVLDTATSTTTQDGPHAEGSQGLDSLVEVPTIDGLREDTLGLVTEHSSSDTDVTSACPVRGASDAPTVASTVPHRLSSDIGLSDSGPLDPSTTR